MTTKRPTAKTESPAELTADELERAAAGAATGEGSCWIRTGSIWAGSVGATSQDGTSNTIFFAEKYSG